MQSSISTFLRQHRIEAVGAVGFLRSAGPTGAHLAKGDAVAAVDLDGVALGVFDRQVFDREVLLAGDQNAFAAGALPLLVEGQDRLVGALRRES